MKLMAIETSTLIGSVALTENGRLVYEQLLGLREDHSARLMPAIDAALTQTGWTVQDIDGCAVAIGPGSFTSLRVGLATVKGLSLAADIPVVAVPTLDAMAWSFPESRCRLCPMIDARMKQVYSAIYEWRDDGLDKLTPDLVASVEDVLSEWTDAPTLCYGTGAELYRNRIDALLGSSSRTVDESLGIPRASRIAMLALEKFDRGEIDRVDTLEPVYLRKSEAERVRDLRRQNG